MTVDSSTNGAGTAIASVAEAPPAPPKDPVKDLWQSRYEGKTEVLAYPWSDLAMPAGFMPIYIHPEVSIQKLADKISQLACPLPQNPPDGFKQEEYWAKMVSVWVKNYQTELRFLASPEGWFITENSQLSPYRGKHRKDIHRDLLNQAAEMMGFKAYLTFVLGFRGADNGSWPDTEGSTQLSGQWGNADMDVGWGMSGNFHAHKMPTGDAPFSLVGVRSIRRLRPY